MSKIKILVDGHVLDGKPQGTCSYLAGLYGALSKFDDIEIYMLTKNYSSVVDYFGAGHLLKWVELKSDNKYKRLGYELSSIEKKIKPDFSHFQYITPVIKSSFWVNTVHDVLFMDYPSNFPWTYKVLNRFLFKISASRSDLLLTVSDYSRKRISHHFGIDSSDIYITPNAVDNIVKFAPEPVTGLVGDDYLLYVSRIEPRKNQHRLAEAFLKANVPRNMKLVFVGAKSLPYAELEPYMNKENIIHLAGVSSGNIAWLYKNAVASIYPSLCEGFGIPPLEASILGCPSYCANNTALSELRPFLNGMFDGEKVEDIVEVIHDSMQAGHSSVDKDSINDKFMWENIAADYRDVLFKRLDTI